jgi:trimeric autotransporter adhesin
VPTPMMVTATKGGAGGAANGMLLRVLVLTGVSGSQSGAGVDGQSSATGFQQAKNLVTTVTGSRVYGVAVSDSTGTLTAFDANTTLIDGFTDSTNSEDYTTFRCAPTGTPGSGVKYGLSQSNSGGVALAEVLPNGTINEDASAPAVATALSATTVTTASFTPPAGALMVALVSSDGTTGVQTMDVQGGGVTWTEVKAEQAANCSYAGVWMAYAPAPPDGDPVITATQGGSTFLGIAMRIYVLTGAQPAASQAGATQTQTGAAAHQATITTTVTGSRVYGALFDDANNSFTAGANTTLVDNIADASNAVRYGTVKATALTGTPGATSIGASAPADAGSASLLEILPSGTLTEDASAPPVVSTLAAITVSCANFTPPAGALLVAVVSSNSNTGIVTMTVSGGGLTWAEKVKSNATGIGYTGIWIANVPVVSAAPGLQPPEPPVYHPGKQPGAPFLEPFEPWPPWDQSFTQPATTTQVATASAAGTGAVTAVVTQDAGTATAAAGAGAVTAAGVVISPASAAGAGAVTAKAVQIAPAAAAGAGSVADAVTQIVTGAAAGAGAAADVATQIASASAAGAGAVTDVVTQIATAAAAGAGSVTAAGSSSGGGTGSAAGAGSVSAVVTQIAPATGAGAGSVTTAATQAATATAAGAGAAVAAATQAAGASAAGAGAVADVATQAATSAPAGAGAVTDVVTQIATATAAGAGSVTAAGGAPGSGSASIAGAGATSAVVTQAATATAPGVGSVTAAATQAAKATAAGAGAVNANGVIPGTASAAGAGAATAAATQAATATAAAAGTLAALAVQRATATLTGAGAATAAGSIQLAFTIGTLTAADKPGSVLTANGASSALTASTAATAALTAGDQKTGGPS